ncbi:MAG: hypothetical protein COB23_03035 [Methylophaga sp.]|nr:MAG: hypothetical protein COB23_03035 [Methylophaga sp.]
MSNTAIAYDRFQNDTETDFAADLEAARNEARESIINDLLADDSTAFGFKDEMTTEDVLQQWIVIPNDRLDDYMRNQAEQ